MYECPFWYWFKHRLEEFRKIKLKVDEDFNIQTLLHDKQKGFLKDTSFLLYERC